MGKECRTQIIPSFAKGLQILLVDYDTMSLVFMASMLELCSYKVTTTDRVSAALSMIQQEENRFRLVMVNMDMPDMDRLSFLRASHQRNIQVIMMSSERNANVANKALAEGACLFLVKPVSMDELRQVWQHVCWKNVSLMEKCQQVKGSNGKESQGIKVLETTALAGRVSRPRSKGIIIEKAVDPIQLPAKVTETQEANGSSSPATTHDIHGHKATDTKGKRKRTGGKISMISDDQAENSENALTEELTTTERKKQEESKTKRPTGEKEGEKQEKRTKINSELTNSESSKDIEKGKEKNSDINSSNKKKSRVVWNQELHYKFTEAVSVLGDKRAQPKTIQKVMKVPQITTRQVASHLQKYKAEVQRIQENDTSCLPSSFQTRFQCSPSFETQGSTIYQFGRNLDFGSFVNYDQRTPQLHSAQMSLNGYSSSYKNNNSNEAHNKTHGGFQSLSQIRKASTYSMKGKQPHELEGGTIQASAMNLPNLSYPPSEPASAHLSSGMFQFPGSPPHANQNQDFPPDLAPVFNSTTKVLSPVPALITSGDATNSQTFHTNVSNGSQSLDAVVNQAPAAGSSNQSQPLSEYADIVKILEEDAEEFDNFACGPNMEDLDLYCEWLQKTLHGKDKDP